MTKSLPSYPSLKHLRNEARAILKAHKAGDVSCCAILKNLHQFKDKSDDEILKAEAWGVGTDRKRRLESAESKE